MDLSLVPIEKLVDEIISRGSCGIVFITGLDPEDLGYVNWTGDYYKALGLCVDMQHRIQQECADDLI